MLSLTHNFRGSDSMSRYSLQWFVSLGTVAFRPLDLRSEVYEVANDSTVLARERWLTAEQIRISLLMINTFGDDMFKTARVLQSYFYAISDLTIGARFVHLKFLPIFRCRKHLQLSLNKFAVREM